MKHEEQVVKVLKDIFKDKKIRGVEIGTGPGCITSALLDNIPNLEFLYTIDPYKHFEGKQYEAAQSQQYHNNQYMTAVKKLMPHRKRLITMKMTSDKAIRYIKEKVDFVWIDGHHSKEQATKDISNYRKLLKPENIIGGHDYGLVDEVDQAVNEAFKKVETGGDYTWWVKNAAGII